MMSAELNKTKDEAMSMWNRSKEDDEKRVGAINEEKRRIEEEYRAREEIMRRGNEERLARDQARKEEIKRQEQLLSGRTVRAKTTDPSVEDVRGGGIQIYHYKDPGTSSCLTLPSVLLHCLLFGGSFGRRCCCVGTALRMFNVHVKAAYQFLGLALFYMY